MRNALLAVVAGAVLVILAYGSGYYAGKNTAYREIHEMMDRAGLPR